MIPSESFDRLMSEAEVIDLLGLGQRAKPRSSLRWLMRTRRIGFVRLAKGIYGFKAEHVAAFIKANSVPATA